MLGLIGVRRGPSAAPVRTSHETPWAVPGRGAEGQGGAAGRKGRGLSQPRPSSLTMIFSAICWICCDLVWMSSFSLFSRRSTISRRFTWFSRDFRPSCTCMRTRVHAHTHMYTHNRKGACPHNRHRKAQNKHNTSNAECITELIKMLKSQQLNWQTNITNRNCWHCRCAVN